MRKRFVAGWLAVVTAVACVCCLASCQKEMPKRLDGMVPSDGAVAETEISSDASAADGTSSQGQEATEPAGKSETFAAPRFQSGSYVMEASTVNEQYIYQGKTVQYEKKVSQIYTYGVKLTVKDSGAMKAVYTFRRIRTGYEDSEGAMATDTKDKTGRTEDNAVYYDLIGQSFTVNISKDYKLSVTGIDAIHKKVPEAADIIDDENMTEVAADLFYRLPENLAVGDAWKLTQSDITNTYRVGSVKAGNMYVNIKGGKLALPEPFTASGITYTYTSREPLSGSLVMAIDNRMIQEQSSYQENKGTMEYEGQTLTFTESAASVCSIETA